MRNASADGNPVPVCCQRWLHAARHATPPDCPEEHRLSLRFPRTVEGRGHGLSSHQLPTLQRFSKPVICTAVRHDFPRGECCVPCLANFVDLRTSLPQHTHTQHPWGPAFAGVLWERRQLCPKLVHLIVRPVLLHISFENISHRISFWKVGFIFCLKLVTSQLEMHLHGKIVLLQKAALIFLLNQFCFIPSTSSLVLILKCLSPSWRTKCSSCSKAFFWLSSSPFARKGSSLFPWVHSPYSGRVKLDYQQPSDVKVSCGHNHQDVALVFHLCFGGKERMFTNAECGCGQCISGDISSSAACITLLCASLEPVLAYTVRNPRSSPRKQGQIVKFFYL